MSTQTHELALNEKVSGFMCCAMLLLTALPVKKFENSSE